MFRQTHQPARAHALAKRRQLSLAFAAGSVGLLVAAILTSTTTTAQAADSKVGLGTAAKFAVLAGSTVTNTGASVITGDLGLSPGSSVPGFPPGLVLGSQHVSDAVAVQAKKDLTTAYNDAASRPMKTDVTGVDLAGMTLTPGVYEASSAMALTGDLTLNAQGNSAAVFIFKAGSTLITGPNSTVKFVNGGSACNVFWQVGSSATLNTTTRFIGTIMANTSATLATGARVQGRVLARTGAVTLDRNVITAPNCGTSSTGTPTTGTEGPGTQTPSTTGGATSDGTPGTTSTNPTPGRSGTNPVGRTPSPSPTIPVIPKKHPETGLGGSQTSSSAPLFVLTGLSALAALVMAGLGLGRAEKRRR
jgi:type VI secretion system secreted protein VgrG